MFQVNLSFRVEFILLKFNLFLSKKIYIYPTQIYLFLEEAILTTQRKLEYFTFSHNLSPETELI